MSVSDVPSDEYITKHIALRSPSRRWALPSDVSQWFYATAMTVSKIVAGIYSGKFYFDDTTVINRTTLCCIGLNDNHKTSLRQQIRNISRFTWMQNRFFQHWRACKNSRSIAQPMVKGKERLCCYAWQRCDRGRPSNLYYASSTGAC